MRIKSLTIYCSSSKTLDKEYYNLGKQIGIFLAKKSIKIIYGGGNSGVMGKISKSSFDEGGDVTGKIPRFLADKQKSKTKISKNIIVRDMSERKKKLFSLGDAFLIFPGGPGTIEEATEIISWKLLGLHKKEIIIFNYKGYWNDLYKLYNNCKVKKFTNKNLQNISKHVNDLEQFTKIFS